MLTSIANKYNFDPTGTHPLNLVTGEYKTLLEGNYRVLVPEFSPFYSKSLQVFDRSTGTKLTEEQFVCLHLHVGLTVKTHKEVSCVVAVIDPKVSGEVEIVYQTVGGSESILNDPILELIETLKKDTREVNWNKGIENKPESFPPSPHTHNVLDVIGWGSLVEVIRNLRDSILTKDRATHKYILDMFEDHANSVNEKLSQAYSEATRLFDEHLQDRDNPHNTTKHHVGLGQVENLPVATVEDVSKGKHELPNDRYMTPFLTRRQCSIHYEESFKSHVEGDNPHNVDKFKIGLGQVMNYPIATVELAEEGEDNESYVTPNLVKKAITYQAITPLNDHKSNVDNPHNVTKDQVGLGNLENYPPATLEVSREGVSHVHYSTPATVKEVVQNVLIDPLTGHEEDYENPHKTTKEQIDLGNVENYPPATSEIAREGLSDEHYLTPSGAMALTEEHLINLIDDHKSSIDNPHNVTKDQVGLGNLENYPPANIEQSLAGLSSKHYMTPNGTYAAVRLIINDAVNKHANKTNPHNITKSTIGLGLVQNFSVANDAEAVSLSTSHYMTPKATFNAALKYVGDLISEHKSTPNPHGINKNMLGLGNVENKSLDELKEIFASKDHTHIEFLTNEDLINYVKKEGYSEGMNYVKNYIDYAVGRYAGGDLSIMEPTKPIPD